MTRIDQNQPVGQPDWISVTGPPRGNGGATPPKGVYSPDKVSISDMAAQLSADPQKLAQLAASVQAGTYSISANQIASSIINSMLSPAA